VSGFNKDTFNAFLESGKGFSSNNYTNAELKYILKNAEEGGTWLDKTEFMLNGERVRWNGDWFEPIPGP